MCGRQMIPKTAHASVRKYAGATRHGTSRGLTYGDPELRDFKHLSEISVSQRIKHTGPGASPKQPFYSRD